MKQFILISLLFALLVSYSNCTDVDLLSPGADTPSNGTVQDSDDDDDRGGGGGDDDDDGGSGSIGMIALYSAGAVGAVVLSAFAYKYLVPKKVFHRNVATGNIELQPAPRSVGAMKPCRVLDGVVIHTLSANGSTSASAGAPPTAASAPSAPPMVAYHAPEIAHPKSPRCDE